MQTQRPQPTPMSDLDFRLTELAFNIVDFFYPHIDRRVATWGIKPGMTLVDYGCGPGRYTMRLARLVGDSGKVYAVDIQPLAIQAVERKMRKTACTTSRRSWRPATIQPSRMAWLMSPAPSTCSSASRTPSRSWPS